MYKQYLLECMEYQNGDSEDPDSWCYMKYYFDTEKEMIGFVKSHCNCLRNKAAFKLEKLSNDIFT